MTDLPTQVALRDETAVLRRATAADVPEIVALLVDDPLGQAREGAPGDDLTPYLSAFDDIGVDPRQLLVVADADSRVVGTFQVTFIPGLSRRGAWRGQVEAVRVAASHRGQGLGAAMMRWVADEARQRGCAVLQLTTDKTRLDAHRFYERLGFVASHEGYKLPL